MGWRFHRSIKILPGLHLHLSKTRGVSISAAIGGLSFNLGADGKTFTTVGLHGTGLSFRKQGHIPGTRVFHRRKQP